MLRPFAWNHNNVGLDGQQHATVLDPTCCIRLHRTTTCCARLHGTTTMLASWPTACNSIGPNMLRPFAWNHNVGLVANNVQQYWTQHVASVCIEPQQCWPRGQQHATVLDPTCCVRLHGTTTMLASWPTACNSVGPNMLRPFAWNRNNVGSCFVFYNLKTVKLWRHTESQHLYCSVTSKAWHNNVASVSLELQQSWPRESSAHAHCNHLLVLLYQNASLLWTTANNVGSCCIRLQAPRNNCQQFPTLLANNVVTCCVRLPVYMGLNGSRIH